jgi:AAA domain
MSDPLDVFGDDQSPPTDLLAGLHNGRWLDAQEFPPLRYAIPGLIPEGLSLIVGAPKIGKSWWALGTCLAAASGGVALGRIPAGPSRPVLYLALEDSDRRLQDRCRQLLEGDVIPPRFEYLTRIGSPGEIIPTVAAWIDRHKGEQPFVIVDTLGKVMPLALQGETTYQRDYRITSELKQLCDDDAGSAIGVNHHDRKAGSDYFVDHVSGTNGLAGGADTILVLSRARGEPAGLLRVTGRDVPEGEYALTLANGCRWQLDGADLAAAAAAASTARVTAGLGDRSAAIIAYIAKHPDGVRAEGIAAALEMGTNEASTYLARLHDAGRIQRPQRGLYTPVVTVTSVTSSRSAISGRNTHNTTNTPAGRESASAQDAPTPNPDSVSALPPRWMEEDDRRRMEILAAAAPRQARARHRRRADTPAR